MIEEARQTFQKLKRVFINASVLQYYDFQLLIRIKIDAFKYEIERILTQKHANEYWHFTAYFSYKFKRTKKRWNTHDKELYVIVLNFKNWRHYLQNSRYLIYVIFDHVNLRYFMTTKKFNARQVRWIEKLAAFDFNIEYRKEKANLVDASSRRFDIIKSNDIEELNNIFLSTLRNKLRNKEYQLEL